MIIALIRNHNGILDSAETDLNIDLDEAVQNLLLITKTRKVFGNSLPEEIRELTE